MASDSKRENVFELLASRHVFLREHVQLLLQTLGYQCVRTISIIKDITAIEKSIRLHIANGERFNNMQYKQKLKMFGEFFVDSPSNFAFLDGECISILVAVDECKKILSEREDIHRREIIPQKRRASQPTVVCETTSQENERETTATATTPRKRKRASQEKVPLSHYVSRWLSTTKYELDYSFDDCHIVSDQNKIVCKMCPQTLPFAANSDALGRWKINTFTSHLTRSHLKRSFSSTRPNAMAENRSLATSFGQQPPHLNNDLEKDDSALSPSKRSRTESTSRNIVQEEQEVQREETISSVDSSPQDF